MDFANIITAPSFAIIQSQANPIGFALSSASAADYTRGLPRITWQPAGWLTK